MATNLNALTLRIGADTSGVSQAVKAVSRDVQRINRVLRMTASSTDRAAEAQGSLNRVYKTGAISQGEYARATEAINKRYKESSDRLNKVNALVRSHVPQVDRLQHQMRDLKAEYKAGNVAAADYIRTMRSLSDSYRRTRLQAIYATDATRELNQSQKSSSESARRSTEQTKGAGILVAGLSSRLFALGAAYTAVRQATKGAQDQFQMDRAVRQLEIFSGSEQTARQLTKQMESLAAQTPLTFGVLANSATRLAGVNVPMEEMADTLERLGDISRGNTLVFDRLSLAYSQILGKGRLMGQELNQLSEGGFQLLNVISNQTGESISKLRDRMEKGGITAAEVTRAIKAATSEGGKFNNLLGKLSDTNEAKLNKLSNSFAILRRNISSIVVGPLAKLSTLLTGMFDYVNRLFDKVRENIDFVQRGNLPAQAQRMADMGESLADVASASAVAAEEAEKQEPRWKASNRAVHELIKALDKENQQIIFGNKEYERRQLYFAGATEDKIRSLRNAQKENELLKEQNESLKRRQGQLRSDADALAMEAKRIEENFKTPFEKLTDELTRINRLRLDGLLSQDAFEKAKSENVKGFVNKNAPIRVELPPSIISGSREEYRLIAQAQNKTVQAAAKRHAEMIVEARAQKLASERAAQASEDAVEELRRVENALQNLSVGEAV